MTKIDLHLPVGWNKCTTEELEHIATAIVMEQQAADRYHPYDWVKVKLQIVLTINGIEVQRAIPGAKPIDAKYLVKRPQDDEPWEITLGELQDLTERLDWITDENAAPLWKFPYPELEVKGQRSKDKGSKSLTVNRSTLIVTGPPPLLDGYTWQEYRLLTDWMQVYTRVTNFKLASTSTAARNKFLAVLFKPKEENSSLFTLHSSLFEDFSPIKWQVILFWWSGLMQQLAKKFPRVFKKPSKSKKGKQQKQESPWDFYNVVTATVQKYVGGLSEQDINSASYGTILQQLEMMAKESEEMEKISKKK